MCGDSTISSMHCIYECLVCDLMQDMSHHLELKLLLLCPTCHVKMILVRQVCDEDAAICTAIEYLGDDY